MPSIIKLKKTGAMGSKAIYTVLGLNMEGKKEIFGLYVSESEGPTSGYPF